MDYGFNKGDSGLKEIFLGSNAERMVRFSHVPVLLVKEEKVDLSHIRRIVFATSMLGEEQQGI